MPQDTSERNARQQILAVALDLFARRGFEATSVKDIARGADTGPRTVYRHFRGKSRLYAEAAQLAGDRFLQAMRRRLELHRPILAETLAQWVGALENGGGVSALVCTASGRARDPAVVGPMESLNGRLVDFWQQRLAIVRDPAESRPVHSREMARLLVAAAPAFASASEGGPVVRSALMADFAATLERMVLDYDGDADPLRPRANGAGLEGGVAFAPEPLHGLNDDDPTAFSPRELEVLLEVERGISNKQIGQALGMTEHTVKFHLKNIFRKLAVSRRTEALKVARELRVI